MWRSAVNMFNMNVLDMALYTIYTAYEELNNTSSIIFSDDYCGAYVYP